MEKEVIKQIVTEFVVNKLFNGKKPDDFNSNTLLVSSRLIDSIVVLKMVNYFEESFNIEFDAHEVNVDNLDSINIIANFILKKKDK